MFLKLIIRPKEFREFEHDDEHFGLLHSFLTDPGYLPCWANSIEKWFTNPHILCLQGNAYFAVKKRKDIFVGCIFDEEWHWGDYSKCVRISQDSFGKFFPIWKNYYLGNWPEVFSITLDGKELAIFPGRETRPSNHDPLPEEPEPVIDYDVLIVQSLADDAAKPARRYVLHGTLQDNTLDGNSDSPLLMTLYGGLMGDGHTFFWMRQRADTLEEWLNNPSSAQLTTTYLFMRKMNGLLIFDSRFIELDEAITNKHYVSLDSFMRLFDTWKQWIYDPPQSFTLVLHGNELSLIRGT